MTEPMTTCPDPTHRVPDEVRHGSDEAYRRWLDERSPCPTCQEPPHLTDQEDA